MSGAAMRSHLSGDVCVLTVFGEIDMLSAPHLLVDVQARLPSAPALVLDLTAVSFIDSSGLRLLDTVRRACAQRHIALRLVAPTGSAARRLLELMGMVTDVVVDSLDDALAALRRGPTSS